MILVTLPLYVLRELGKAIGLSLLVFTFVLLAFVAGGVIRDGASIFTVAAIVPKLFPLISPMVLPLTIITGTLICYGRIASTNEFTAARAGGVAPVWLALPALAVSVLAATITVYLNADVLSVATASIEKTLLSDRTEILRQRLSKSGSFSFEKASICRLPPDATGRTGIDITFFTKAEEKVEAGALPRWDPAYPYPSVRIVARDHDIDLLEAPDGTLYVQADLKDFTRFDLSSREMQTLSAASVSLKWPIHADTEIRISEGRLSYWGISKLLRSRRELRREMAELQVGLRLLPAGSRERALQEGTLKQMRKSYYKQTAELHLKLALSFACIGFAVVGIPLGLLGRRESATTGFAYGILVALGYFVIVKALQSQVRDARLDFWIMWIPNALLIVLGGVLWQRSHRRG